MAWESSLQWEFCGALLTLSTTYVACGARPMIKWIMAWTFVALTSSLAQSPYPTPKPDGTARTPRNGTCPTGYVGLGKFCEALHKDTPTAHPKIKGAPCPSGTFSSGDYGESHRYSLRDTQSVNLAPY